METVNQARNRLIWVAGVLILLFIIFGVPAVLVPMTMDEVPERSRNRVVTHFQAAVDLAETTFSKHRQHSEGDTRRLMPVPDSTQAWIETLNPMGRKAPGGGLLYLPEADSQTGAIGIQGNSQAVTITMPAYRELPAREQVVGP